MPLRPLNECYTFPLFSFFFGENQATCLLPKTHTPWLYCYKIYLRPLSPHPSPTSPNFVQPVSSKATLHLPRWGRAHGDGVSWQMAYPNTTSAQEVPHSPDLLCLPKNKNNNKKKSLNLNIFLAHAWECLQVPWLFHEVVHGWHEEARVGILHFLLPPHIKMLAWQSLGLLKDDASA